MSTADTEIESPFFSAGFVAGMGHCRRTPAAPSAVSIIALFVFIPSPERTDR
jgi:hypothetical protein